MPNYLKMHYFQHFEYIKSTFDGSYYNNKFRAVMNKLWFICIKKINIV